MEMSHLRLISTIETLLLKPIKMFSRNAVSVLDDSKQKNKRTKAADVRNEFFLSVGHCHFCNIY